MTPAPASAPRAADDSSSVTKSSVCVPRRSQPRVRLAAGSVGIAGGRTGIYTLPSPGGWQIVGRTPMPLFDSGAAQPFRLRPGMRVRFVAIGPEEFDAWCTK